MALRLKSYGIDLGGVSPLTGGMAGSSESSFATLHSSYCTLIEDIVAEEEAFLGRCRSLCLDYLDVQPDFLLDVADDPTRALLRCALGFVVTEVRAWTRAARLALASETGVLSAMPAEQTGVACATVGRVAVTAASASHVTAFTRYTDVYVDVVPGLTRPPPLGGFPDWRSIMREPLEHLAKLGRALAKVATLCERIARCVSDHPIDGHDSGTQARLWDRYSHETVLLQQTVAALRSPANVSLSGSSSTKAPAAPSPTPALSASAIARLKVGAAGGAADSSASSDIVVSTPRGGSRIRVNISHRVSPARAAVAREDDGRGSRVARHRPTAGRRRRARSSPASLMSVPLQLPTLPGGGVDPRAVAARAVAGGARSRTPSISIESIRPKSPPPTTTAAGDPLCEFIVHESVVEDGSRLGRIMDVSREAVSVSRGSMSGSGNSASVMKRRAASVDAAAAALGLSIGDLLSFTPETLKRASALKQYFREYYSELFRYLRDRMSRTVAARARLRRAALAADEDAGDSLSSSPVRLTSASAVNRKIDDFFKNFVTEARAFAHARTAESEHLRERRMLPKLSGERFAILARLGQGSFGEVFLVRDLESDVQVAMKKIKRSALAAQGMSDTVDTELAVLKGTGENPWLVGLRDSFADPLHVYMCMEYVPGGDLESLLSSTDLEVDEARFYSSEVVASVDALHDLGYVHRDLKPDNFLITAAGHLKLADFGLSKQGVRQEHTSNFYNMVPYRVFTGTGSYKTMGARLWTVVTDVIDELCERQGVPVDERGQYCLCTCSGGDGVLRGGDRKLERHETIMGAMPASHGGSGGGGDGRGDGDGTSSAPPTPSSRSSAGKSGSSHRSRSGSITALLRPRKGSGSSSKGGGGGSGVGGELGAIDESLRRPKAGASSANADSSTFVFGLESDLLPRIDAVRAAEPPAAPPAAPDLLEAPGSRFPGRRRQRSLSVVDSDRASGSSSRNSSPGVSPRSSARSVESSPAATASTGFGARRRAASIMTGRRSAAEEEASAASSTSGQSRASFTELRAHLRRLRETDRTIARSIVGTPYYMAPEMLAREGYTNAVDVWSVGCLVYELHAGVPPFRGDTPEAVFASVMDYGRSLVFDLGDPDVFPDDAIDLITKLLVDAQQRLTLKEAKNHSFFDAVNFDALHGEVPPFVPGTPEVAEAEHAAVRAAGQSPKVRTTVPIRRKMSVAADGEGDQVTPMVVGSSIEGYLVKRRRAALASTGAKRWAALISGALVFLHERSEAAAREAVRKPKSLEGARLLLIGEHTGEFSVDPSNPVPEEDEWYSRSSFDLVFGDGERYCFEATSPLACRKWVTEIASAIDGFAERQLMGRSTSPGLEGAGNATLSRPTSPSASSFFDSNNWAARTYRRSKKT
jgi:serine/threonine protein kinase